MKAILTIAVASAALFSSAAWAKKTAHPASVTKTARDGDIASRYVLRADGHLFRQVGTNLCEITNEVYDFKIADNPHDPAAAYIVRKGGLFALTPARTDRQATQCPKAKLELRVPALDRNDRSWQYLVVNRKDTPLSLIARGTDGRVTAWDARGVAVYVDGTVDLRMNSCFGSTKSFGSYVAFAIDRDGYVSKIGGKDPRKSKADPAHYETIDAFMAKNHVCH